VKARVALLGNMNNNHFAMVRYLRASGIDAELLLFDVEDQHFHPKADSFDTEYMNFTRQLAWGSPRRFVQTSAKQIQDDLAPYDLVIGCGLAPAYCYKANRVLDIFVPYGGDIWMQASYRLSPPYLIPIGWPTAYYQRKGIRKSKVFHMSKTNMMYEGQYQKLKGLSERWYEGLPMVYAPGYEQYDLSEMASRTHWGYKFSQIRKDSDLMVVSHMRHIWSGASDDPSVKGNDILLRGWKLFCERNKKLKAKLVLTEYGQDVKKSHRLVQQLELGESVVWLPQMYRKDIMVGLYMADIVCGEFVNSWMSSGILYEALVAGKPILARRDDDLYLQDYPNLYPILNARDSESIAARLEEYIQNPELGRQMGRIGHQWYEEEVERKALDRYIAYIERRSS
jgi:glycosyltransferase involved in cell wall biosynthesis